jgi:hypothetical protein
VENAPFAGKKGLENKGEFLEKRALRRLQTLGMSNSYLHGK